VIKAKILNGYDAVRLGRFDVVHDPDTELLMVTFVDETGQPIRYFIYPNGEGTYMRLVVGCEYDDQPDPDKPNTPEMTIKIAQQGFNIEFDKQSDR
jgi:hypothetical protein